MRQYDLLAGTFKGESDAARDQIIKGETERFLADFREAIEGGLTVEEADALSGKPMGFPKTGVFGLMDLVGIDLGPHIAASLLATLPADDGYRDVHRDLPLIQKMIAGGLTGRRRATRAAHTDA